MGHGESVSVPQVFTHSSTRFVSLHLKMRYVAAYLLASLGGNTNPSSDSIVKILSSVGIEAEADKLEKVIAELSGKDLKTVIAEGQSQTCQHAFRWWCRPSCRCCFIRCCPPAEAKKEEKKEESEEEDDDMGFGLF